MSNAPRCHRIGSPGAQSKKINRNSTVYWPWLFELKIGMNLAGYQVKNRHVSIWQDDTRLVSWWLRLLLGAASGQFVLEVEKRRRQKMPWECTSQWSIPTNPWRQYQATYTEWNSRALYNYMDYSSRIQQLHTKTVSWLAALTLCTRTVMDISPIFIDLLKEIPPWDACSKLFNVIDVKGIHLVWISQVNRDKI